MRSGCGVMSCVAVITSNLMRRCVFFGILLGHAGTPHSVLKLSGMQNVSKMWCSPEKIAAKYWRAEVQPAGLSPYSDLRRGEAARAIVSDKLIRCDQTCADVVQPDNTEASALPCQL